MKSDGIWDVPLKYGKQVFLMEKQGQESRLTSGSHCDLASQGNICSIWRHFWVSQLVLGGGSVVILASMGRGQGCC